ncbi:hypothetical protein [Streptomyces sp. NPDC088812]|uniref:hypothetical protein n=1 Tax=Streptomyces sp. NPDC088812 TaxID=3365905 RepID=UPI0038047DCA
MGSTPHRGHRARFSPLPPCPEVEVALYDEADDQPRRIADRTLTHYLRLPYTATPDVLTRAVAILASAT